MHQRVLSECSPAELIRHEGSIERALGALSSLESVWHALQQERLDLLTVSSIDESAFDGLESLESQRFEALARRVNETLDRLEQAPGSLTSRIKALQSRRTVRWPSRLLASPTSREGDWGRYRDHSFQLSVSLFVQHERTAWVDVNGVEVPRSVVLGWRVSPDAIVVGRAGKPAGPAPTRVRVQGRRSPYLVMYGLVALMLVCWLSSWLLMASLH